MQALHQAIAALTQLSLLEPSHAHWLASSHTIVQQLISTDDWLPDSHAASHPQFYQQHALYLDPLQRFSVSSFVWGPGQGTPIHNHTIAGWVGVLRGAELCQRYSADGLQTMGLERRLSVGMVDAVSPHDPSVGDVHTVRNAYTDRSSISIHVYAGDIASVKRSVFSNGLSKPFQSQYSAVGALIPAS